MQVNYKEQLHLELCLIEDHEYKREELLSIVAAKIAILSIVEILKICFKDQSIPCNYRVEAYYMPHISYMIYAAPYPFNIRIIPTDFSKN